MEILDSQGRSGPKGQFDLDVGAQESRIARQEPKPLTGLCKPALEFLSKLKITVCSARIESMSQYIQSYNSEKAHSTPLAHWPSCYWQ